MSPDAETQQSSSPCKTDVKATVAWRKCRRKSVLLLDLNIKGESDHEIYQRVRPAAPLHWCRPCRSMSKAAMSISLPENIRAGERKAAAVGHWHSGTKKSAAKSRQGQHWKRWQKHTIFLSLPSAKLFIRKRNKKKLGKATST